MVWVRVCRDMVLKWFKTTLSYSGLYGRRVIVFTRSDLSNHSFSNGDIVGVTHKDLNPICEGVVSRISKHH